MTHFDTATAVLKTSSLQKHNKNHPILALFLA